MSEDSTKLEPAAWIADTPQSNVADTYVGKDRLIAESEADSFGGEFEPLVRPDQLFDRLMRIVEEHRHRAEDASAAGNEKERYACESVADVIYDEVMQWKLQLKEFTQNGGSE